jgi:hypothetical protein
MGIAVWVDEDLEIIVREDDGIPLDQHAPHVGLSAAT